MSKSSLKPYFFAILFFAFIGFVDSIYLTAIHFLEQAPGCGEGGGCDEVATSEYSTIWGIPISIGGIGFYTTVIFLSVLWIDKGIALIPKIIAILAAPAFLFSVWLVYLQLFVIEAICVYCMISAGGTTLIFMLSLLILKKSS